ncbi:hypothetical protein BGZ57DRAFT_775779 [Hyaloscypha finlandica]|nr:hypothetical protein BGZ57DRAFT_775779 [Hyaloscypha finlandica]
MGSLTLIHFVAVLGVHRHSLAYKTAYNSTSELSYLIWIGRLLFLEYALPLHAYTTLPYPWPARHSYPSQAERLEAIRTKYLLRGSLGPFGEILERRAYGHSIVKKEGHPGTLTWAADGQSFTLGNNQKVQLIDFCKVYSTAIANVIARTDEMMLSWKPAIDLATIRDDLTCRTPRWSFLNHIDNDLTFAYKALSRQAWTSSFSGAPFAKAGYWLPATCVAYLQAGTQLSNEIFAAIHLAAGLPARGTEITSIRLRNTPLAIRHVFIREGRMLLVISYNKSRASNNHAFYIVRYLPQNLAISIFKYLVYIRPVCQKNN